MLIDIFMITQWIFKFNQHLINNLLKTTSYLGGDTIM